MRLQQIFAVSGTLVAVAIGLFAYKAIVLDYPVLPNEDAHSWHVEAKIRFTPASDEPVQVHMFKPQSTTHLALVDESVVAPNYGTAERIGKTTRNKIVNLTRRHARGQQVLFYQAIFYEVNSAEDRAHDEKPRPMPSYVPKRADQMGSSEAQPLDLALNEIIAEAKDRSADNVSFALEVLDLLSKEKDDRVVVLQNNLPEAQTKAARAALIINAADIPARVVNGVVLQEGKRQSRLTQWLEVYADGKWQSVDVDKRLAGIENNYLPWWRGTQPLVRVDNGANVTTDIAIKYNRENAVAQAQWKSKHNHSWIAALSLFDVPIETQLMLSVVLMIPIGGLVIVLLRQLVGVPTFGTFMPVLIALAFRDTGLLWGIVFFGAIVMIGLYLRAYFDRLRLLVVPRLASVLTIVVLLIAAITVISYKLGINAGLSITLFPMIILTMTIERMSLMTEEFGAREARRTAYGSFFAATMAYFAMHNALVSHLVFVFPELLLIVLACTILLGRYNGYKLSEYMRFKKLARAIAEKENPAP